MLLSKIDQMKLSDETGSEANFGFGRALILAACSCPVLHMASDSVLLAMCLCFCFV